MRDVASIAERVAGRVAGPVAGRVVGSGVPAGHVGKSFLAETGIEGDEFVVVLQLVVGPGVVVFLEVLEHEVSPSLLELAYLLIHGVSSALFGFAGLLRQGGDVVSADLEPVVQLLGQSEQETRSAKAGPP